MTAPPQNIFKLAGPEGDGRLPYLNADGAFLGAGVPLLECDLLRGWRPRPRATLENLLRIGCGVEVDLADGMGRLAQVARALNDGELGLAAIALVQAKLPTPLDPMLADRMAKADGVAKYNADQPRSPRRCAGWRALDNRSGGKKRGL